MPEWDVLYMSTLTSVFCGQTCQNVLWFRTYEGSPHPDVQSELTDLHTQVQFWFVNEYINFANADFAPQTLVTKVMAGALEYQAISHYVNVGGARIGQPMPPHDAAVISFYTPFHGKRLHGRCYLTGLSEDDQESGILTAIAVGRLQSIGQSMLTRFGANGSAGSARGVVFSRKNGVTRMPGPPPFLSYQVAAGVNYTRVTVSNRVCTMRKRKIR